jgi:hypothetical protein
VEFRPKYEDNIYSDLNYYLTIWTGFIWLEQCIVPGTCELSDRRIP